MVLGGIPGQWVAGRAGAVIGTFLASGLYHELGFYLIDRGFDHRVTFFFLLQSLAFVLEELYTRYTGRRVGGWAGRVWTYLWILGIGQMCCKEFFLRCS